MTFQTKRVPGGTAWITTARGYEVRVFEGVERMGATLTIRDTALERSTRLGKALLFSLAAAVERSSVGELWRVLLVDSQLSIETRPSAGESGRAVALLLRLAKGV